MSPHTMVTFHMSRSSWIEAEKNFLAPQEFQKRLLFIIDVGRAEEAGLLCGSLYIITSYLLKHAASQIRIAFHENPCKENVVPLINIP